MKRSRPEEQLHRAVAQYLDLALPKEAVWFHVPNGMGRSKAEAGILKAMGVKAGVPDIYILHAGKSLFIELKASGGSLSWAQREMRRRLAAAGASVMLARSIDDVAAMCRLELGLDRANPSAEVTIEVRK